MSNQSACIWHTRTLTYSVFIAINAWRKFYLADKEGVARFKKYSEATKEKKNLLSLALTDRSKGTKQFEAQNTVIW